VTNTYKNVHLNACVCLSFPVWSDLSSCLSLSARPTPLLSTGDRCLSPANEDEKCINPLVDNQIFPGLWTELDFIVKQTFGRYFCQQSRVEFNLKWTRSGCVRAAAVGDRARIIISSSGLWRRIFCRNIDPDLITKKIKLM